MRGPLLLLTLPLVLAGCASPSHPAVASPPPAPAAAGNPSPAPAAPVRAPLRLDGSLGLGAWTCVFQPASVCPDPVYAQPSRDRELEVRDRHGIVVAARVTLTWSAASPATTELGMGLMSMGPAACNCTAMIDQAQGASPLVIDVPQANVSVPEGSVIHLFVYGTIEQSSPDAYAYGETPQDFHAEGFVDLAATRG